MLLLIECINCMLLLIECAMLLLIKCNNYVRM